MINTLDNNNNFPLIRQQRETSYKEHEAQHMGSRGDLQAKIDISTDVKLEEIDVSMGGMLMTLGVFTFIVDDKF